MARKMGIDTPLEKNLSLSLGTSEVTPLELTSAYTVFPNMGMTIHPVLIKRVEDRFGNVLEDNSMEPLDVAAHLNDEFLSTSENPSSKQENESDIDQAEAGSSYPESGSIKGARDLAAKNSSSSLSPGIEFLLSSTFPTRWIERRASMERTLSPSTAYLMLSMLRETCVSGTAASVSRMRRKDLAGKTGTTDDCTDAWFVGFNSKYTTGVWLGYDTKISLGKHEYGGTAALPVWVNFMTQAIANERPGAYPTPPGIVFTQDEAAPGHVRQEDLLEANPDFALRAEAKQMCPVDAEFVTASFHPFPFMGQFSQANFGQESFYGGMRFLSAKGEPLDQVYNVTGGWDGSTFYRGNLPQLNSNTRNPDHEETAPDSSPSRSRWDQDLLSWVSNYLRGQGAAQ
jgi:penicillin-binding protein 1A